ncbi:hypothetical protein [Phenylobacterium sp.]
MTSAAASAELNSAIEAWGDDLAAQVAGLCRWHRRAGMRVDCPPAPD